MIDAILSYHFMQNALLATLLSSIICGIIGTIIVEKKLVMMGGGIAHTAYGGVGLGYLLGFNPIFGAIGFSTVAALGIGYTNRTGKKNSDITTALFWSLGMASGVLFTSLMPSYPPDMNSYLFGNILSVTDSLLIMMAILTAIIFAFIAVFYHDWNSYLFDNEYATISGMNTKFLEYLLSILIALSVVTLIRVAGIILIIALISAPAATAALMSQKLKNRMILATLIGVIECFLGLTASYTLNIASGASIVIIAVSVHFLAKSIQLLKAYWNVKNKDVR